MKTFKVTTSDRDVNTIEADGYFCGSGGRLHFYTYTPNKWFGQHQEFFYTYADNHWKKVQEVEGESGA